jgi:amino acid transporter
MHATEMLVAVLIPLSFFAMVFGIVYMYKRENLAMIEKGLNPKEFANRPVPYKNLKWGLLLVGAGLGLLIAFFVDIALIPTRIEPVAVYFALIAVGGGLGLVSSYRIEKKELLDREAR